MWYKLLKGKISNRLQKDLFLTLLFGILSIIFRFINFSIPGVEGIQSDLRELPLIIGIIHLSNPLHSFGLSALSSISFSFNNMPYISTFMGHVIPLFILWYFFNALKKQKFNAFKNAITSLVFVLIYYLISILLATIIPNVLIISDIENKFISVYKFLLKGVRFEMIYTAIAISFYFVQYKLRIELQNHKQNLEKTINERTEHLHLVIEELKTAQYHLVQSEKMASLGNLTAGVAHEINNPLNFIAGGLNIIQEIKPEIEKNISADLNKSCIIATDSITEGLNRSVNIVNALMTFSKKGESKLENQDIQTIIDNTLLFMMHDIPKDINIIKEYGLDGLVPVYIEKLHQVFINLLNNAIYALNSEGLKEKKIIIKTFKYNNCAVVEIFNSGPEIPLKFLNQIFDPFFTTKAPNNGKGLGLSICYTYLKEHKGTISADNVENGVKFKIELPLNN